MIIVKKRLKNPLTIVLKQNLTYVIPTKYLLTRGLLAESTAVFNKLNSANSLQKFTKKVLGKRHRK